jgi:hypothetical protein
LARIAAPSSVALASAVSTANAVTVAVFQAQRLGTEVPAEPLLAVTYTIVAVTVGRRLALLAAGFEVAGRSRPAGRAEAFGHGLCLGRPISVDRVGMLNANPVAGTVGELALAGALGPAAIFAAPTPSARARSPFHAVPVAAALVLADFGLALLPSVIAKAVARSVEAMPVVAAVAVALTKLAVVAFPVSEALAREIGLADTVVAAVASACPFRAVGTAPAVPADAFSRFAAAVKLALFRARGDLARETCVTR